MRWANPHNKFYYYDPGRRPQIKIASLVGGDIWLALIGTLHQMKAEDTPPSDQAYFVIAPDDMDDLISIHFGDSRFAALQTSIFGLTISQVPIRLLEKNSEKGLSE